MRHEKTNEEVPSDDDADSKQPKADGASSLYKPVDVHRLSQVDRQFTYLQLSLGRWEPVWALPMQSWGPYGLLLDLRFTLSWQITLGFKHLP